MTSTPDPDTAADGDLARWIARAVALPDAPPALVHAAIGLWKTAAPAPAALPALWRRVVAALSFDSAAGGGALAMGVRGGAGGGMAGEVRQLLYTAGERDIDLRVSAGPSGWALVGQVLGPDSEGEVAVHRAGEEDEAERALATAPLDALGEFRFDGVPAGDGALVLTLRLGEERIALPPLTLGAAAGG